MTAEPEVTQAGFEPEPRRFRQVLGHFCTGVTVITALVGDKGEPVGFACQSFAAVSLEPPLVLFCPSRGSATWPRIERAGDFCANVLTDGQRELSRRFGSAPRPGPTSSPGSLEGLLVRGAGPVGRTHLDRVRDRGRARGRHHFVVIGRVIELGECAPNPPLLFYRGRYAAGVRAPEEGPPEVVDTLLAWPRHADWM